MVRPGKEGRDLDDDTFAAIIEPTYNEIRNYLDNEFIYDFFARCLATDFKNNSIWDDSKLEYEFKDAISFLENMPKYNELNIDKLNQILKEKHSLKITSVNPIGIEKM